MPRPHVITWAVGFRVELPDDITEPVDKKSAEMARMFFYVHVPPMTNVVIKGNMYLAETCYLTVHVHKQSRNCILFERDRRLERKKEYA